MGEGGEAERTAAGLRRCVNGFMILLRTLMMRSCCCILDSSSMYRSFCALVRPATSAEVCSATFLYFLVVLPSALAGSSFFSSAEPSTGTQVMGKGTKPRQHTQQDPHLPTSMNLSSFFHEMFILRRLPPSGAFLGVAGGSAFLSSLFSSSVVAGAGAGAATTSSMSCACERLSRPCTLYTSETRILDLAAAAQQQMLSEP